MTMESVKTDLEEVAGVCVTKVGKELPVPQVRHKVPLNHPTQKCVCVYVCINKVYIYTHRHTYCMSVCVYFYIFSTLTYNIFNIM